MDDHRITYPAILESELRAKGYRVSVVNAGTEGWTSYETLINFAFRVQELEPDMVILYHSVNDIRARMVWPPEAYRPDNAGFRGPNIPDLAMPSVLEHSTLLRVLGIKMGFFEPHGTLLRTYDSYAPTFHGYEWYRQHVRGTYPSGVFKEVSVRDMLETNRPIYFRRNLENLIAMAQNRGIACVLATFAYSPDFPDVAWTISDEMGWVYEESNAIVRDVAASTGAVLYDFAKEFPTARNLYTDGIHVNKVGARKKGKFFAAFLMKAGLIPARYREFSGAMEAQPGESWTP